MICIALRPYLSLSLSKAIVQLYDIRRVRFQVDEEGKTATNQLLSTIAKRRPLVVVVVVVVVCC